MTSRDATTLPEYANNPFIAGLPPIRSPRELLSSLQQLPEFDEAERSYSAVLRKHCVLRLQRFFAPMARQIVLAERLDMLIRQGYIGRNPNSTDFISHLQNGAERIEAASLNAPVRAPVMNTAAAFALAGCSGVGKTLTTDRVLLLYPQRIIHTAPFSLIQISWLKLECPTQGSPRQLCIAFFRAVDALAGTDYFHRYGGKGVSAELMLGYMAQVAQLHALGVLVVDEIQNLKKAAIGPDALLNFLVTLINTIGIPVVLIGTLAAVPLLQGTFRNARRADGLGSAIWDRMLPGKEWDQFINRLWACQWTRQASAITPQIRDVLYDESQGVIDIVVKLYMLAQLRLIGLGEVRKNFVEAITPELLRQVAREELRIVRPMIMAMRTNDKEALKKYEDLTSLQEHVARTITDAMFGTGAAEAVAAVPSSTSAPTAPQADVESLLLATLAGVGVAEDVAKVLVASLMAKNPTGDPLLLLSLAREQLTTAPPKVKPAKAAKKDPAAELPVDDLRRLVSEGIAGNKTGYEALLAAGMVRAPRLDFAA